MRNVVQKVGLVNYVPHLVNVRTTPHVIHYLVAVRVNLVMSANTVMKNVLLAHLVWVVKRNACVEMAVYVTR